MNAKLSEITAVKSEGSEEHLEQESQKPETPKRRDVRRTQDGETARHPLAYKRWHSMIARCTNPNCHAFKDYGLRGIVVCDRWKIFKNFLADMGDAPIGMELDRIDNNSGYSPSNCRWADLKTQNRNKRSCRILSFNGVEKCVTEWSEYTGIPRHNIFQRLEKGWSVDRALTTQIDQQKRKAAML